MLGVELFCFAGVWCFASVGFCLWFGGLFVALLLVGLGLWLFVGWFDLMWVGPRYCGGRCLLIMICGCFVTWPRCVWWQFCGWGCFLCA